MVWGSGVKDSISYTSPLAVSCLHPSSWWSGPQRPPTARLARHFLSWIGIDGVYGWSRVAAAAQGTNRQTIFGVFGDPSSCRPSLCAGAQGRFGILRSIKERLLYVSKPFSKLLAVVGELKRWKGRKGVKQIVRVAGTTRRTSLTYSHVQGGAVPGGVCCIFCGLYLSVEGACIV